VSILTAMLNNISKTYGGSMVDLSLSCFRTS